MNIISKKKDIVELLKKGTDVEEICTDLGVSTSYVYRIKREMDESEGDEEEAPDTEKTGSDGVVIDSTGGAGSDVEGNNENMEDEEDKGKTDKTDRVGGVKKRKKRVKKEKKEEKKEEDEDEKDGGIVEWLKKKWKRTLLISSALILLIIVMLSSFLMKSPETTQVTREMQSRFPMIHSN